MTLVQWATHSTSMCYAKKLPNVFEYLKCDIFSYSTLLPGTKAKYWAVHFVIEQNPFNPKLDCTMYMGSQHHLVVSARDSTSGCLLFTMQGVMWGSIRNLSASHALLTGMNNLYSFIWSHSPTMTALETGWPSGTTCMYYSCTSEHSKLYPWFDFLKGPFNFTWSLLVVI